MVRHEADDDTTTNRPGFVLLETAIPYDDTARFLLGCVVADIRNPTDDYQPEGHYHAFQQYTLEVFDVGYSAFVAAQRDRTFEGRLGRLVGADAHTETQRAERVQSTVVRTKLLMQHPKIHQQLLAAAASKRSILDLMKRNGGKGFLVVGFKSALDATHARRIETTKRMYAEVEVPVDQAAAAAAGGAGAAAMASGSIGKAATNPKVTFKDASGQVGEVDSTLAGERIIAVRYRLLTLPGIFGKKCKLGEVVRVTASGGVFGGGRGGGDDGDGLIFDDEDTKEESSSSAVEPAEKLEIQNHDDDDEEEDEVDISPRLFEDDLDILGYRDKVSLVY